MANKQVRIEKINVKDLDKFACNFLRRTQRNCLIPITKHRALAQIHNPSADEKDIGLLVAYIGDQCIGYLGIMPGLLRMGEQFSKIYFLSAWFVPEEFRKTSAGLLLLMEALSMDYDFIAAGMSNTAERIYRSLGFHEIGPLNYYVIELGKGNVWAHAFRLMLSILRKLGVKSSVSDPVKGLSGKVFKPVKKMIYMLLVRGQKKHLGTIRHTEVSYISEDAAKDRKNAAHLAEFYRGVEVINWMLRYKWVLGRDESDITHFDYHFSNVRDVFKYIGLEIYLPVGDTSRGFLVMSLSSHDQNITIKVLDFHFPVPEAEKYLYALTLKYASVYQADRVELPASLAVYAKGSTLTSILIHQKKHIYLCRPKSKDSPLAMTMNRLSLSVCDGDLAFF